MKLRLSIHKELMTKKNSKQGVSRREFLTVSFAAGGLTLIPHAFASTKSAAGDAMAYKAFTDLSTLITAENNLKPGVTERLYLALIRHDKTFADRVKALHEFVTTQAVSVSDLQKRVEANKPELADVPKAIASAWFEGLVGKGADAEVVLFSEALMYVAVADVLKPPSYSLGEYGIWQTKPPEV